MGNIIYYMDFDNSTYANLFAIVSAESEAKAQGLLEKKMDSTLGFKIWETVDSGFKSNKEGIIGIGRNISYNESYSKPSQNINQNL